MYIYFVGCFVAYILSYYFYEYMHKNCRVFNPTWQEAVNSKEFKVGGK